MVTRRRPRDPLQKMGAAGGGTNVIILMTIGIVGGVIADMLWYSLGLPGYNVPLRGCDALSVGDAVQIAATGGITFLGFLTKSKEIPAFSFGLMLGGLFPKVMTKAVGAPRYLLFDIDLATGGISPVANLRGTPFTPTTVPLPPYPEVIY